MGHNGKGRELPPDTRVRLTRKGIREGMLAREAKRDGVVGRAEGLGEA